MTRTELEGLSNLKSIGYDESTQTVEVEFRNRRVYQYFDVPPAIYRMFWILPDKDHVFNNILKVGYAYKEIK
jgi:hypothetical protein